MCTAQNGLWDRGIVGALSQQSRLPCVLLALALSFRFSNAVPCRVAALNNNIFNEFRANSTVQVIGVEQAMDRVRELKKLGPPKPVKGERARSKRRVPVVAVIGAWNPSASSAPAGVYATVFSRYDRMLSLEVQYLSRDRRPEFPRIVASSCVRFQWGSCIVGGWSLA